MANGPDVSDDEEAIKKSFQLRKNLKLCPFASDDEVANRQALHKQFEIEDPTELERVLQEEKARQAMIMRHITGEYDSTMRDKTPQQALDFVRDILTAHSPNETCVTEFGQISIEKTVSDLSCKIIFDVLNNVLTVYFGLPYVATELKLADISYKMERLKLLREHLKTRGFECHDDKVFINETMIGLVVGRKTELEDLSVILREVDKILATTPISQV